MTTYLPLLGELAGLVLAALLLAYVTRHQAPSNSLAERSVRRMQRKARKQRKPEPLPHSAAQSTDPAPTSAR